MNEKITYQAPDAELVEINFESRLLDGSVGTVRGSSVSGWDSDEEDW